MPVLQPNEYDISYFDGKKSSYTHNAGFTSYDRWYRKEGENSLGEYWKDVAVNLKNTNILQGKKVIELGCAKGFIVQDLREMGVNAYGMDISQYAIDCANNSVKPYIYKGDARLDLTQFTNKEFDFLFSFRFIECIDDSEINSLITSMTRISKKQLHIFTKFSCLNSQYYNAKSLEQWSNYNWPRGTIFTYEVNNSYVIK